jgi:chitin disaccharide deacetylase
MRANERLVIVNADDFGLSEGVNAGIIDAHERGIVTSASLLVRWPAARSAAAYVRTHPELSLGLHIDLAEWIYGQEGWVRLYEVVPSDDEDAAHTEIRRQLAAFGDMVGRNPTHLDSHQHVHLEEPVRGIALQLAGELGVPLRSCTPNIRYCGDFYAQTGEGEPFPEGGTVEGLRAILSSLTPGITEVGCHPGRDENLATTYRAERAREVTTLCDPRVRETVRELEIGLISFGDAWEGALPLSSSGALPPSGSRAVRG